MSSKVLSVYTWLFLGFLFAPMLLMISGSAIDFGRTDPDRLFHCISNSFIVAAVVVPVSVLLGLCGAIVVTRVKTKYQSALWWFLMSPILTPGIVVGLATLIFWKSLDVTAGLGTIILAQSAFIASYCMLVFVSRLEKFPIELERSALSLGASPVQTFFKITLQFLKPAFISASVIAFLISFENYNTTMFVKGGSCTLATEIGDMTRNPNGYPPIINALGTVIIGVTLVFAVLYTLFERRSYART